ncbi:SRPBCC family protein [Chelativorans alearense]|uniref:SRPBCC family protein n=1 Tax=Chelativorans alearense TaxID=2681495 RepID=UPI0013D34586|nr:SRPBCC family protein [Chelativorans alearense]
MIQSRTVTLTVKRHFDQSPDRVFDAWLDPERARRWLFATESGDMIRAEIDGRVGGGFTFTERRDGEDVEHVGEYLTIERPKRLVFTLAVPKFSPDADTVTIDLTEHGGGTELTLTHQFGASNADWEEPTREGWTMIFDNLAKQLDAWEKEG